MPTCQHCGIGNEPRRALCTTCGGALPTEVSAESAQLSALWSIRFDLVEKAGGPALPLFKQLRFGERFRLVFNLWALLFGCFYYLAKGMWRRAITLVGLSLAILMVTSMLAPHGGMEPLDASLSLAVLVWFAINANTNYYKKVVLGDNGWW